MLKDWVEQSMPKGAATSIKDAEFPAPFASELELIRRYTEHGILFTPACRCRGLIRSMSVLITACGVLF